MIANPKLIDKLYSRLAPEQAHALSRTVELAAGADLIAYLVGGPIRDLLLERPSADLDVVVEGDAIRLAQQLAADIGAKVKRYPAFGTATVYEPHAWHIDLITARSEIYTRPGALPTVKPATISEDLARRDFSINAMALTLNGPHTGELLDPHDGRDDLDAGLIRVLHERSFQDDATRIFRAARYAARFNFRIEPQTLAWLERDLSYVETISGARIRREFERSFEEERPHDMLMHLHSLGALKATHPGLTMTHAQSQAFARLAPIAATSRPIAFAILAWETPANQVEAVTTRLTLTKAQSDAVRAVPAVRDLGREPLETLRPSQSDAILSRFPLAAVTALSLVDEGASGRAAGEWLRIRKTRPILRGDDLVALGVPRGPALGEVLARLRAAKLDGEVTTRTEEEAWVRDYLARNTND